MPAADPGAARAAALFIHGLPEETRGRVIAGLTPFEASRLAPLLKELHDMRVMPSTARLMTPDAGVNQLEAAGESARERVVRLTAAEVDAVLRGWPPAMAAMLLEVADWPWADELHGDVALSRSSLPGAGTNGSVPRLAPGMAESLCERLLLDLPDIASRQPVDARHDGRPSRHAGNRRSWISRFFRGSAS